MKIKHTGKDINFEITGKGKPIVLLHGFLESLAIWERLTNSLSDNHQVIAIDLPGHGETSAFSEIHTMEFMADIVKAVLNHQKIEQCLMIGHSMGGYVTLAFAEQFPNSLNGFSLFHSSIYADSSEAKTNRERAIQAIRQNHTGFIHHFIPDLFAPFNRNIFQDEINTLKNAASQINPEAIIAVIEGMKIRTDKTDFIKTTQLPFQIISGKYDSRIPINISEEQSRLTSNCDFIVLEKSGHMGYIEEFEKSLKVLEKFANKVFQ